MKIKHTIITLILSVVFLVIAGGSLLIWNNSGKQKTQEVLIAKVGDKTISLDEFIRRAEYTIRPRYCNRNDNLAKKTVLNSLIAEKLLVLEAGDENILAKNIHFQRFIEGRRQQAMRQWLFHMEGTEKVRLDTNEIKKRYLLAGREYRVEYFSVNNDSLADLVVKKLQNDPDQFAAVWYHLSHSDSIPERQVDYDNGLSESVHKALFSKSRKVGEIIGPLPTGDGSYLVMKVAGWTDKRVITQSAVSQRWNDVRDELQSEKAAEIYRKFVAKVMHKKTLDFSRKTFNQLARILAPVYIVNEEQERNQFLQMVFNKHYENDSLGLARIDDIGNVPLFRVDNKQWTVNDFLNELEIHPLVFRKEYLVHDDFVHQFRLAIVDMIRDKYLAEAAYKRGYDKVEAVQRNVAMWKDASIALYQRDQYLSTLHPDKVHPVQLVKKYLNPYVDTLQHKYSSQIEINVPEFNNVKLTSADMFVTQANVPFPIVVPAFPVLTTDPWLNYGNKMAVK